MWSEEDFLNEVVRSGHGVRFRLTVGTGAQKLTSPPRAEIEYPRRTGRGLVSFVELAVDRKTAIFVSSHASGPTFIELVLALDELSLRGGHVGREGE